MNTEAKVVIEFGPFEAGEMVHVSRNKLQNGDLYMAVAGQAGLKETSRAFLSLCPIFLNPSSGNEIVAGGWENYRRITEGPRKDLICHKRHTGQEEQPRPPGEFHWLDELPEDHPMLERGQAMLQGTDLAPRRRISWPQIYSVCDRYKFPTSLQSNSIHCLYRLAEDPNGPVEELEEMDDEKRERRQEYLEKLIGPTAHLAKSSEDEEQPEELARIFACAVKEHEGQILAPMWALKNPKNVDCLADITTVPARQELLLGKRSISEALRGKWRDRRICYDLFPNA